MLEDFSELRKKVAAIQNTIAAVQSEIERLLVFDEAVSLAYKERTGLELQCGEPYTAKDAERAEEILNLYPWNGA